MAHLLVVPGAGGDELGGVTRSRESTTGHTWMEELGNGSRASVTTLAQEACLGRRSLMLALTVAVGGLLSWSVALWPDVEPPPLADPSSSWPGDSLAPRKSSSSSDIT